MRSFISLFALVLFAACAAPEEEGEGAGFPLVTAGSAEETGLVAFLNDPATTFALLDIDVGLDRRAAENLIAQRDVQPFASAAEVDAVPWVGPVAMDRLLAWARDGGWFEVGARLREAAILAMLRDPATSFELLDLEVGLDVRAARGIVERRDGPDGVPGTGDDVPFTSLAQVDAVPYVGPVALDRLAVFALGHGYGEEPPPEPAPPCAIFSEYTEGSGNNNKAVELYNCGAEPLALSQIGVCLVRNDDTTCSNTATAGTGMLAPGAVTVLCRTKTGTFLDPHEPLAAACDHEIGGAATFNGDDRLVLFEDADGDGALGPADAVLDAFGDPATRPSGTPWAEVTLRRCDLAPHLAGPFTAAALFTSHARTDYTHLGVPPDDTCGTYLGGVGDDCLGPDQCAAGLRCWGRPGDGSTPYGKCVDPAPLPGEGARCDRWTPCADGLICAGWTLWAEGTCNPQWMAGRFEWTGPAPVADPPSGGVAPSVVVYGLASVPVDLDVVAHIEHPRPTDLRVTLIDPSGDSAVLWDRTPELLVRSRSFVTTGGISRDAAVNGRWHLRVEDLVTGETGTVEAWSLFVTSRWD